MRHTPSACSFALASVLALTLVGCGNSTPEPAAAGGESAAAYKPSSGSFVTAPATSSQKTKKISSCNLDAINGNPVADVTPLSHSGNATFTGWAGDAEAGSAPSQVRFMLQGAQTYVVTADTGMPRPDVAQATNTPALANAGYSVVANLSAVAPGQYTVLLGFTVAGQHLLCDPGKKVTIQ